MLCYESLGNQIVIRGRDENSNRYEKTIDYKPYFYITDKKGEYTSLYDDKLIRIECDDQYDLYAKRKKYNSTFESDVPHEIRYLIDNYTEIDKEPIRICFFDIETEDRDGFPDVKKADKPILSIAFYDNFTDKYTILITSPTKSELIKECEFDVDDEIITVNYIECKTESQMLKTFMDLINVLDFDIFYAWNGGTKNWQHEGGFDYPMLFNRIKRLKLPLETISPIKSIDKRSTFPNGRAFLDLMKAHRKLSTQELESYALDAVGDAELGIRKVYHEERIGDMWEHDLNKFSKYNLKDVYIMVKIEQNKGITDYFDTIRRTTFCKWDDLLWNSKVLDTYALKYAKKLNVVLPDKKRGNDTDESIQGARVLTPVVGIHKGCAVVDVRSLYPSAILTCNMSPETIIDENYAIDSNIEYCKVDDICFRTDIRGFIPLLIEEMWDLRQTYKKERDKHSSGSELYHKFDVMQTVAKMNLNSIYGVLLLKVFRLYSRDVGKSITYFGREYNKFMEKYVIDSGHKPVYGDSVTKNTKIDIVGKGRINIQDLFTQVDYEKDGKEYCNLKDVYTPTIDDNGKHVTKNVPYVMRHKTNKQIFRVNFSDGKYVDVTEDHSLIGFRTGLHHTRKGSVKTKNRFINISPLDIDTVNKRGISFIGQQYFDDLEIETVLPMECYRLIGYFLGDGNIQKMSNGGLQQFIKYTIFGDDVNSFIEHYLIPNVNNGYIESYKISEGNGNCKVIFIRGKIVKYILEHFQRERIKYFNFELLRMLPKYKIADVIRGLMDSDGTISYTEKSPNPKLIYYTSQKVWADNMVQLLKLCGVSSAISIIKKEEYKGIYTANYDYHHVRIKSIKKYRDVINFNHIRKKNKLDNCKLNQRNYLFDFNYIKIKSVEKIEYNDYVYDIEVEDTHRFFANNILVSNTDSCCFKLHESTFNSRIEEAENLTKKLNDISDEWCKETWGSSKYNKLYLEFEQIYQTLITLPARDGTEAKKRYFGLVYYKDGVDLRNDPEMCIKGISSKRSDTPNLLRSFQKDIFKMVLLGREDEAKTLVKQMYFDITNNKYTPEELAIPKGMSKAIDEYDGALPIHIRGAKYFNNYCGGNIKRDKIKYIYVQPSIHPKGAPQTNVISFVDKFPSDFKPDFITMADKLLIYQYDTLFKVMKWDIDELKGQCSLAAWM